MIPFAVTIPPEEQDAKLVEKLRGEWPGILRWMVEGCLAWQKEGMTYLGNVADEIPPLAA